MSNREPAECHAFRKCFADLADGISDPGQLAVQLYSKELIGRELRTEAQKSAIEERVKIVKLLSAVEDQIVTSPATKFREFLDLLQSEQSLQHLATRLENTHHELCTLNVSPSTSSPSLPTSSPHLQHPQFISANANSCLPLPPAQGPRTGMAILDEYTYAPLPPYEVVVGHGEGEEEEHLVYTVCTCA